MRRRVIETVTGTPAVDGAGVHLVRVLGQQTVYRFDPFLMLDAFDSYDPKDYIKGFPMHPHRGIETFTYLMEGRIDHEDSLDNKGTIHGGEIQWMTGGSGILHQEMPQPTEHLLGLQLWINLPAKDKMTEPKYFDITKEMVKTVDEENASIRVVAGKYKNHQGAKGHHVQVNVLEVKVKPNEFFSMETDPEENLFVYIVDGEGRFGSDSSGVLPRKVAALFDKGDEFYVRATEQGIRFIMFSGKPLREQVVWGGPIVMNTREDLFTAFEELSNGNFIKHKIHN